MGPQFYIIVIGIKYNYYAKIPNFYNGSPQGFYGESKFSIYVRYDGQ